MDFPFSLTYLSSARENFRAILERAEELGLEESVIQAAQIIDTSLQENPREFGDPTYTLHSLNMFHRAVSPLFVIFGVHKTDRLVFVQTIKGMRELG